MVRGVRIGVTLNGRSYQDKGDTAKLLNFHEEFNQQSAISNFKSQFFNA
jgi:hypothetical protein